MCERDFGEKSHNYITISEIYPQIHVNLVFQSHIDKSKNYFVLSALLCYTRL